MKDWESWLSWVMEDHLKPVIAAKTIEKHLWIIINAIVLIVSNGPAEGINSRAKTIKVHCPGFRNKQRFVNAVAFVLENLICASEASP